MHGFYSFRQRYNLNLVSQAGICVVGLNSYLPIAWFRTPTSMHYRLFLRHFLDAVSRNRPWHDILPAALLGNSLLMSRPAWSLQYPSVTLERLEGRIVPKEFHKYFPDLQIGDKVFKNDPPKYFCPNKKKSEKHPSEQPWSSPPYRIVIRKGKGCKRREFSVSLLKKHPHKYREDQGAGEVQDFQNIHAYENVKIQEVHDSLQAITRSLGEFIPLTWFHPVEGYS